MYEDEIVVGVVIQSPQSFVGKSHHRAIDGVSRTLGVSPDRISSEGLEPGELYVSIPDPDPAGALAELERLKAAAKQGFMAVALEEDIEENGYTGLVEQTAPELITTPGYSLGRKSGGGTADIDDRIWHLRKTRLLEAWPVYGMGRGVVIAQPDTGYTRHHELDGVPYDLGADYSFIRPVGPDAEDQLLAHQFSFGHGSASASVLASPRQTAVPPPGPEDVWGCSPEATVLPLRCVKMVARITYVSIARAVRYAAEKEADIIYLCLGGLATKLPFSGTKRLRRAIDFACERGTIVIAAAGNPPAKAVVYPAVLDNVITVAASDFNDQPCAWSCRGKEVNLSAPGDGIYRAKTNRSGPDRFVCAPSWGTTYATTQVASAAAIWLSHHGRDAVEAAAGGPAGVWRLFRRLVTETTRKPEAWDSENFGTGILDVMALLEAPLLPGA